MVVDWSAEGPRSQRQDWRRAFLGGLGELSTVPEFPSDGTGGLGLSRYQCHSAESLWVDSVSQGQHGLQGGLHWAGRAAQSAPHLDANGLQYPPLVVIQVAREHHVTGLLGKLAEEVCEIGLGGEGE